MNTIAAFTIVLAIYGHDQPPVTIVFRTLQGCFEGVIALSATYPEAECRGPNGLVLKHTVPARKASDAPAKP